MMYYLLANSLRDQCPHWLARHGNLPCPHLQQGYCKRLRAYKADTGITYLGIDMGVCIHC